MAAPTDLDAAGPIPGYYNSPWPGEDGGPRRQLIPRSRGLGLGPRGRLQVTSRTAPLANMPVLRAPGEVFVQGSSVPSAGPTTGWLERIDQVTLATVSRSPDLPGGPFWPGGVLVHQNGDLYITHGRWCHRLDAGCDVIASRELPRERPYNSLLALSDGNLVMKDFIRDGSAPSHFSVLEPERLEPMSPEVAIPEGSIARISRDITADGEFVYVVGDHTIFRFRYEGGRLERDESWQHRYRTRPDAEQSYGWDPVIAGGHAWFLDNGDNDYKGSLAGTGRASGPVRLIRVSLSDAADAEEFAPFGLAHGTVVNPPLFDAAGGIAVAYDSGNSRIGGFRWTAGGGFEALWTHEFGASNHFLLLADTGEVVVNDFHGGSEHTVVLDIESGEELGRVATGSALQSVTFQSPGWERDIYVCTFSTISRVYVE